MTIPMKALKGLKYAGQRLQPGDEFQAKGKRDARVLSAIGKAIEMPAVPVSAGRMYLRRDIPAAPVAAVMVPASAPVASLADPAPAAAPAAVIVIDGADMTLDGMEADELHALAERLGVKVHGLAGAKKVTAALLEAHGKKAA